MAGGCVTWLFVDTSRTDRHEKRYRCSWRRRIVVAGVFSTTENLWNLVKTGVEDLRHEMYTHVYYCLEDFGRLPPPIHPPTPLSKDGTGRFLSGK